MSQPFLAEIRIFAGTFAPRGWALCNGQLLPISQNTAVFSLIGTFYGGNGTSTFALPDLQSRLPIHHGQGAGLSPYVVGQNGGTENVTLLTSQMPQHNHTLNALSGPGTQVPATGNYWADDGATRGGKVYASSTDGTTMNAGALGQTGGGLPHTNIQPYLALTFIIALQGIFPSRN
ncbi:MAG: tail fiber protein [Candidatus Sulfotelmatobacter sp.]